MMDVLAILFILVVGFLLGYGVREIISRRRHAAARRYSSRPHRNLSSDGPTPILPAYDRRHDRRQGT